MLALHGILAVAATFLFGWMPPITWRSAGGCAPIAPVAVWLLALVSVLIVTGFAAFSWSTTRCVP